jgi:hypothetical protein
MRDDAFDATGHFRSRSARKGEQEDPSGIGTIDHQMRDAMRKGVGLARPGAGNDEKRLLAGRAPLAIPCSTARRWSGLSLSM